MTDSHSQEKMISLPLSELMAFKDLVLIHVEKKLGDIHEKKADIKEQVEGMFEKAITNSQKIVEAKIKEGKEFEKPLDSMDTTQSNSGLANTGCAANVVEVHPSDFSPRQRQIFIDCINSFPDLRSGNELVRGKAVLALEENFNYYAKIMGFRCTVMELDKASIMYLADHPHNGGSNKQNAPKGGNGGGSNGGK